MIKKFIALAATTLVSFNAFAGYVQYDFGGPMSGYFVQHDDDGSIADYKFSFPVAGAPSSSPNGFQLPLFPVRGEGSTSITSQTTYFRNNGPTNFSILSGFGADQFTRFAVDFQRATQGNFSYTATYASSIYFSSGWQSFSGTVTGLLSQGTISAVRANGLDSVGGYHEFVSRTVPTFINPNRVPEPGSLALLAIGAIGAAGASRRRKAVQ